MTNAEHELRVLVVAPTGRDGPLICALLDSSGIRCTVFATADEALMEMKNGAGAVILAEESLTIQGIADWAAEIAKQPSWSDLSVIVLTVSGEMDREGQRKAFARQPLGNVVLLERPVRPETFVSTVRTALRSRHRQYQMRDFLIRNKLSEDALRKSEKLVVAGRLALSISHEINNPLASVTNLLYLIEHSTTLEEAKRFTLIAAGELARVSEIVSQTLRFYREPSHPASVQLSKVIDSALTLYRERLDSANIAVRRDFRDCSPIVAMAGELRQVVLNLIGNALDAIVAGGTLVIRVSDGRERGNGARPGVRITIGDSGHGIDPAVRKTLFEPFITTKGDTGTGLGLWVSSEIIRKHSGTIQVKTRASGPHSGTVFSIFLPTEFHAGAHGAVVGPQLTKAAERESISRLVSVLG
jgi:signal transduction histidine kinase